MQAMSVRCLQRWPLDFQLILRVHMTYSKVYWSEPSPGLTQRLFEGRFKNYLPRFKKIFKALNRWPSSTRQCRASTHSLEG